MFGNETEFVAWLRRQATSRVPGLRLGIGDDAALVEIGRGNELILTTDLSIEGTHFSRAMHPPGAVGHRALARSLSDVAAMGGTPRYALISLGLSRQTSRSWIEEFYASVFALAERFAVKVVGGDTAVVSGNISIDMVVAGEVARGKAIRRSGARPGDQLFVSGRLGLSALGLHWLKASARRTKLGRKGGAGPVARTDISHAVRANRCPEPRCALGRFLSQKQLASSLIDVSDGLSTDLNRLCEASGVGARVTANCLPIPNLAVCGMSKRLDPMYLALNGGEDYELLFSVPKRKASMIPRSFRGVPLHRIGEVTRPKEVLLVLPAGKKVVLKPAGYDHFAKLASRTSDRHG